MHMQFDNLLIVHKHQAVSQPQQVGAESFRCPLSLLVRGLFHDTFRAVGKPDCRIGAVCTRRGRHLGSRIRIFTLDRFSHQRGIHTLQHGHKTASAGIHNLCLLQNRQHLRRLGKRLLRSVNHMRKERPNGLFFFLFRIRFRLFRTDAHDRQNGSLRRIGNRLIRFLGSAFKSLRHILAGCGFSAAQGLRHAAEKQRKNRPGVAACGTQTGRRRFFRALGNVSGKAAQLFCGIAQRQTHIDSGIPIRHRKDIQIVDRIFIVVQCIRTGNNHIAQGVPVDNRFFGNGIRSAFCSFLTH